MRVALVGPPQSGKSTLFAAVAEAGGSHVDIHRPDQPHLAVVKVPDERVDWLAQHVGASRRVCAELEFVDLPGLDLRDESGRHHARHHAPAMRQSEMLVLVLREFHCPTVAAYRGRLDPVADARELRDEILFSDLEQVTSRIEKLDASIRKPSPHRDEQKRELELMQRLREALENERPLSQAVQGEAEEKLLRSFAFLTLKPALVVLNCDEQQVRQPAPTDVGGWPCMRLSARIEEEIARLEPSDREEFLADLGAQATARDVLIRGCYRAMKLVSFLTWQHDECRAWTVPAGTDAVGAAGAVHSDMARGFIRAETVAFEDLRAAGDFKAARSAGKIRLEGKTYVVQDGDVITFRFHV